jgi:hypothetical protein
LLLALRGGFPGGPQRRQFAHGPRAVVARVG